MLATVGVAIAVAYAWNDFSSWICVDSAWTLTWLTALPDVLTVG